MLDPLNKLPGNCSSQEFRASKRKRSSKLKNCVKKQGLLFSIFNITFNIHNEARNFQLVVVVLKEQKPVALIYRKLMETEKRCTTTEDKIISILENLKEFCSILLSNNSMVYIYHNNLTQKSK